MYEQNKLEKQLESICYFLSTEELIDNPALMRAIESAEYDSNHMNISALIAEISEKELLNNPILDHICLFILRYSH